MPPKTVPHYPALDGLRAVAILVVLFHHFGGDHLLKGTGIFIDSRTGVQLFFILSGFLVTRLLIHEQNQFKTISIRSFYIRRALRILPVAYLFLLVLLLLNYGLQLNIRKPEFITAIFFIDNFPIRSGSPYTAHLWTLAAEVQFYLLLPLCLLLGQKRYFWLSLAVVALLPVISISESFPVLTKICRYFFWKGPFMIMVGSVISLLDMKSLAGRRRSIDFISLTLLVIAFVICSKTFMFYNKYNCEWLSGILMGLVVLRLCQGNDLLSRLLSYPLLRWIGRISYSLYIWQQLFIGPNNWQPWLTWIDNWPLAAVLAMKFLAAFGLAALSYYLFERFFLRLKVRFYPGEV